jgi:hypothetical protein
MSKVPPNALIPWTALMLAKVRQVLTTPKLLWASTQKVRIAVSLFLNGSPLLFGAPFSGSFLTLI